MKFLRTCALVVAIACTAQAGEIQYGVNGTAPDIGTELLVFLSLWF
jgi:hypothetical protein